MDLKIKIFADGADKQSILNLAKDPKISGFTTNPTLMRKAGITDYKSFALDLLSEVKDKPISFEVFSDEFLEMREQALKIASWGENVYVKIPIINTKGESSIELIRELSNLGVKLNITAVFTLNQVREVIDALNGNYKNIISVFCGRLNDIGVNVIPIMQTALYMCKTSKKNIELLWASTRELYNIIDANRIGCDIITVPNDILGKLNLLGKDVNEMCLNTVEMFYSDGKKSGYNL